MIPFIFATIKSKSRSLSCLLMFAALSISAAVHASSTKKLNISADFRFETFKTTTLDVSVFDTSGNALEGKLLRVFSVIDTPNRGDGTATSQRSSLLIARTDAFGRVYTDLQIANSTSQLLLVVDAVGNQNEALVDFDGEETISRQFRLDMSK